MNNESLNYSNDPGWLGQLWHPEDVLVNARLSKDEKRALLAAWASDERTVLGDPTLRQLPNGAVVGLASILDALRALDASEHNGTRPTTGQYPDYRHDRILSKWRWRSAWHYERDDDGRRSSTGSGFHRGTSSSCLDLDDGVAWYRRQCAAISGNL